MANTYGEKELRTDWPIVSGLGANDKHEGRQIRLKPQIASLIPQIEQTGIDG